MRRGMWMVITTVALLGSVQVCHAIAPTVGDLRPLGPRALEIRMARNRELAGFIALRGYPDWVEEIEVDNELPLDTHEVRLYYLRLDREIAFTQAFVLGRPIIGVRLYERPLDPAIRERIDRAYLAYDPVRRAELAAARAVTAAERSERAAESVEAVAARAERFADAMERDFHRRLRK